MLTRAADFTIAQAHSGLNGTERLDWYVCGRLFDYANKTPIGSYELGFVGLGVALLSPSQAQPLFSLCLWTRLELLLQGHECCHAPSVPPPW